MSEANSPAAVFKLTSPAVVTLLPPTLRTDGIVQNNKSNCEIKLEMAEFYLAMWIQFPCIAGSLSLCYSLPGQLKIVNAQTFQASSSKSNVIQSHSSW